LIARPWLIVIGSLAVMAGLAWALWTMATPRKAAGQRGELILYCAAGLHKPVTEICASYERQYGVKVQLETDGSGKLLSKIRVAPDRGDLFLAAEESYVRDARRFGLVAEILPVARQHVVLGVAPGNPHKIVGVKDLLGEGIRVVLPNPELAAVGDSARRALEGSGQWEALIQQSQKFSSKVSLVGTVTEAAQAVKIGAADATLVWDATARQFGIEAVEVPVFQSRTNEQVTLGVLAGSSDPTTALHFARYLTASDRGQPVLQQHFLQPLDDADRWEDHPSLVLMSGAMLKPGVDDLVKEFEKREGVSINTIYAGCGIHVAQMKAMKKGEAVAGHFPDAYFSCDVSFMNMVQQWFEASTIITRNDMVLVVPKGNPNKVRSIEDLTRPELRIGLAHPVNSALGALTDDLLKKLKLHAKVYAPDRRHAVLHTDAGHMLVNQMRAGALDLIVVYRSNVLSNPENAEKYLDVVEMNLREAVAIQPYAVAKNSEHKYLMRRFLEAILSPASQERFRSAGFQWLAESPRP
jgi:molybdenum ABC transporter molybdate-binding protein